MKSDNEFVRLTQEAKRLGLEYTGWRMRDGHMHLLIGGQEWNPFI